MTPAGLYRAPAASFQQRFECQHQVAHGHQQHMQRQPGQAMVLAEIQQLALDLVGGNLPAGSFKLGD